MAETLLSPGVFLNENDLSQITAGPVAAGAGEPRIVHCRGIGRQASGRSF